MKKLSVKNLVKQAMLAVASILVMLSLSASACEACACESQPISDSNIVTNGLTVAGKVIGEVMKVADENQSFDNVAIAFVRHFTEASNSAETNPETTTVEGEQPQESAESDDLESIQDEIQLETSVEITAQEAEVVTETEVTESVEGEGLVTDETSDEQSDDVETGESQVDDNQTTKDQQTTDQLVGEGQPEDKLSDVDTVNEFELPDSALATPDVLLSLLEDSNETNDLEEAKESIAVENVSEETISDNVDLEEVAMDNTATVDQSHETSSNTFAEEHAITDENLTDEFLEPYLEKFNEYEVADLFGANTVTKEIALRALMNEAGLMPDEAQLYDGMSQEEIFARRADDIRALARYYGLVEEGDLDWVCEMTGPGQATVSEQYVDANIHSPMSVGELKELVEKVKSGDFTYLQQQNVDLEFLDQQTKNDAASVQDRMVGLAKNKLPSDWLEDFDEKNWKFKAGWHEGELTKKEEADYINDCHYSGQTFKAAGFTYYGNKTITVNGTKDLAFLQTTVLHEFTHFAAFRVSQVNCYNEHKVNQLYHKELEGAKHLLRDYATTNPSEYIAEFTSYWIQDPDLREQLREAAPETSAFVETLLNDYDNIIKNKVAI